MTFIFILFIFLKKNLEDISSFRRATDTPVLEFWWRLPWISKPGWIPFVCFLCDPQIHLWCDTYLLCGSRVFSIHILAEVIFIWPVTNQSFPENGVPTTRVITPNYYFGQPHTPTTWKWNDLDPEGEEEFVPGVPLDPLTVCLQWMTMDAIVI